MKLNKINFLDSYLQQRQSLIIHQHTTAIWINTYQVCRMDLAFIQALKLFKGFIRQMKSWLKSIKFFPVITR